METTNNMEDQRYRFYGCYQGNYEKHYRWQCKAFSNHYDATLYTQHSTRDTLSISLLIPINKNIPTICDNMIIRGHINQINKVDIN